MSHSTTARSQQPFPGLRPFEPDETDLFFGRGDQIDELLTRLEDHRFVAVVGASGSGKSSLVRAGLLPALEAGFLSDSGSDWHIVIMRPGQSPFSRLASALQQVANSGHTDLSAAAFTEATLRSGPRGLIEAIQDADVSEDSHVLILVDQFEEIFRFRHQDRFRTEQSKHFADNDSDRNDATAFVNMLLATAAGDLPVYIVLTMRSDFLGDCDAFHGLPEAINKCQFLVPRLRRDQLRDTIVGPLDLFQSSAEEGLINSILNAVGSDPDQLPLMQHLLARMWSREMQTAGDPVLELADFHAVGGLDDALSRHADEAYDELSDVGSKRVAELMFRCLCDRSDESRSTRRLVTVTEVAAVAGVSPNKVKEVASSFLRSDRNFLTASPPGDLTPASTLDISHEALIRQWHRLSEWVVAETQSAARYRRLLETARYWKEGKASLLVSPELDIALYWRELQQPTNAWAHRYGGGLELSIEFLDASVAEQQAEAERQRQAVRRKVAYLGGTLAVVSALMFVVALLFWQSRNQSEELTDEWIDTQFSVGTDAIEEGRMVEGLMRYLAAYEKIRPGRPALQTALNLIGAWSHSAGTPFIHNSRVRTAAFSADGKSILTVTDDVAQLWDLGSGDPYSTINAPRDAPWSAVAIDAASNRVAYADGTKVFVRNMSDEDEQLRSFDHGDEPVVEVRFSADGSTILTRSEQYIRLWRLVPTEQPAPELPVAGCDFTALSPSGDIVAVGWEWNSNDEDARDPELHHVMTGQSRILKTDAPGSAGILEFSPGGKFIVVAGKHTAGCWETAQCWETDNPEPKFNLDSDGTVESVACDGQERFLLIGSDDNSARIWDLNNGSQYGSPLLHEGTVTVAAFSLDGSMVLTGSADNSARIWDVRTGQPLSYQLRHAGTVDSVMFSADGSTVLTGSIDRSARLWNVRHSRAFPDRTAGTAQAVFTEDGQTILLANQFSCDVYDVHSLAEKQAARLSLNLRGSGDFVLSPDGTMILEADGETARLKHLGQGSPSEKVFRHEALVRKALFGPLGRKVLTLGGDTLRIWDIDNTDAPRQIIKCPGPVLMAAISPNGNRVATAGESTIARLWNVDRGELIGNGLEHLDRIVAMTFSADGHWVATGGADNKAAIWDAETGEQQGFALPHQDTVSGVSFSPDGRTLLTASYDKRARFWDVNNRTLRGDSLLHPGQVQMAIFRPDGRNVLTVTDEPGESNKGPERLWDVYPPALNDKERLRLSLEWRTGFHRIRDTGFALKRNDFAPLDQDEWMKRKQQLDAMGGPCDQCNWEIPSRAETEAQAQ